MELSPLPKPPPYREIVTERFVLAVDLGQSADPTAIAVIHHRHVRRIQYRGHHPPVDFEPPRDTFDVRHLARLPLGLSYIDQVVEVERLWARPPLNGQCELAIDETGVGRPVGDLFDLKGIEPTRITITGGEKASRAGVRRWHVPKGLLISMVDARLHAGELRFAANLAEANAMAAELRDFRRKVSAAGRYSYEARVGQHDDLVLAVAIGLWTLIGRPESPVAAYGVYSNVEVTP